MSKANRIYPAKIEDLFASNSIRSGVIPYTTINNEIYWLMGISKHYLWSDFGGGCKVAKGETPYLCLIRETNEETNGLLTKVVKDSIERKEGVFVWAAYDGNGNVIEYLVITPIPYQDYEDIFVSNSEILNLVWVPQSEILTNYTNINLFHPPIKRYITAFRRYGETSSLIPKKDV